MPENVCESENTSLREGRVSASGAFSWGWRVSPFSGNENRAACGHGLGIARAHRFAHGHTSFCRRCGASEKIGGSIIPATNSQGWAAVKMHTVGSMLFICRGIIRSICSPRQAWTGCICCLSKLMGEFEIGMHSSAGAEAGVSALCQSRRRP